MPISPSYWRISIGLIQCLRGRYGPLGFLPEEDFPKVVAPKTSRNQRRNILTWSLLYSAKECKSKVSIMKSVCTCQCIQAENSRDSFCLVQLSLSEQVHRGAPTVTHKRIARTAVEGLTGLVRSAITRH